MMSSITPTLTGDIKSSQNTFLTLPVSVEDLHNTRSNRNFWLNIEGYGLWSSIGTSAKQLSSTESDKDNISLKAGFLWHELSVSNQKIGIKANNNKFCTIAR